jgi:hypothetical protein
MLHAEVIPTSEPTVETLEVLAQELGISVTRERLARAAEAHARLRPMLREFRELKFDYLDAVEPAHARRWIENGGRSAPRGPHELP